MDRMKSKFLSLLRKAVNNHAIYVWVRKASELLKI